MKRFKCTYFVLLMVTESFFMFANADLNTELVKTLGAITKCLRVAQNLQKDPGNEEKMAKFNEMCEPFLQDLVLTGSQKDALKFIQEKKPQGTMKATKAETKQSGYEDPMDKILKELREEIKAVPSSRDKNGISEQKSPEITPIETLQVFQQSELPYENVNFFQEPSSTLFQPSMVEENPHKHLDPMFTPVAHPFNPEDAHLQNLNLEQQNQQFAFEFQHVDYRQQHQLLEQQQLIQQQHILQQQQIFQQQQQILQQPQQQIFQQPQQQIFQPQHPIFQQHQVLTEQAREFAVNSFPHGDQFPFDDGKYMHATSNEHQKNIHFNAEQFHMPPEVHTMGAIGDVEQTNQQSTPPDGSNRFPNRLDEL